MPHGMVTWQYAPAQPVEWSEGIWVNARVVRVRWQDEILFQHVWCPPGTNPPPSLRIKGRQVPEPTSMGLEEPEPAPTNAIQIEEPLDCPADIELPCVPDFCECAGLMMPDATLRVLKPRQTDSDDDDDDSISDDEISDDEDDEDDDFTPILQDALTDPLTFPAEAGGRREWWNQMTTLIEGSTSRLRSQTWRRPDGSMTGRGFTSSSFNTFDDFPVVGGTGPMWGCTAVIIMTNNGM